MQKSALLSRLISIPYPELLLILQDANAVLADNQLEAMDLLAADGWEETDAPDGVLLLDDGRPVSWLSGIPFTLRRDIWDARVKEALAVSEQAASQSETRPTDPERTCTALVDGHLCGGDLASALVCPRSGLGKQGVAQILSCDVCGAQTAVMR